ncbi:gamma-glutamylcyclotransferase family protein [Thiohalophilus sp.]|uniref:gamma-glutamylcyclotransferase family protein n=1 Tax=Thiohalophilus sp. TaxID=3028392 RepID=UPI002ACDC9EB|nr:gamma-glutamylcyclotransferase family protein [Thiohalophilus sp.]MDZ7803176.1 gamma-glutamylcyclotransferase family protein [Thiohalophilus sp.]
MLYFAYGSNMSSHRLLARVPSARSVTIARLPGHRLRFHKKSVDGSAKCDIEQTGNESDVVHGVVFNIAPEEKPELDRHEGLGQGYEEKRVSIYIDDGNSLSALTFYATRIEPTLKPYVWYREHVLRGAREHGLPDYYIKSIAGIEAIPDPDTHRHRKELTVYPDSCVESG